MIPLLRMMRMSLSVQVRVRLCLSTSSISSIMSIQSIPHPPPAPSFRPFCGPSPACPDDPVVAPEFSPGIPTFFDLPRL